MGRKEEIKVGDLKALKYSPTDHPNPSHMGSVCVWVCVLWESYTEAEQLVSRLFMRNICGKGRERANCCGPGVRRCVE